MSLWESYKTEATNAIENELIKQYQRLVCKVWSKHFSKIDFDECYSHGLEGLWKAIKNWRKNNKTESPEHEFLLYAYGAIWQSINSYVRKTRTKKYKVIRTNIESFEHIRGLIDELESTEEKRERVAAQLKQLFEKRREATYTLMLKHYGEGIPWSELWEEAGYSSQGSMNEMMHRVVNELRDKVKYLTS